MDDVERTTICKAIARSCMWGQGGIASIILDRLQEVLPTDPSWREMYREHEKAAKREAVGVIDDEDKLRFWLRRGYWLVNFDADGASLFNPPPMNGLYSYVSKDLAEKYRPRGGGLSLTGR